MKVWVIDSSELVSFGIWNAKFYCNSTQEERKTVLNFRSDRRRDIEIKKLKDVLITFKDYDVMLRSVKDDLGLSNFAFTDTALNYNTKVILLIMYRVVDKIKKNIPERRRIIRYEEIRINEEIRKLDKLKGGNK